MAECIRYECKTCGNSVEAWSDGNPYFIDERGQKQYAHHPSADFAKCVGNDLDFLCLICGEEFMGDSLHSESGCPKCGSGETAATEDLEGKRCPKCKNGKFEIDPDLHAIS